MPKLIPLTPFQAFIERWRNGCGAHICEGAQRIVLCKGKIPCDILLVGEGPGESEDVIGIPFVGPAGQLLDTIIERAGANKYRCAFTNLVCCIPREPDGNKATEPDKESVKACSGRLEQFIDLAKPRLIVRVGKLATKWVPWHCPTVLYVDIPHPAGILRGEVSQQPLAVQRCVVLLSDALEEL